MLRGQAEADALSRTCRHAKHTQAQRSAPKPSSTAPHLQAVAELLREGGAACGTRPKGALLWRGPQHAILWACRRGWLLLCCCRWQRRRRGGGGGGCCALCVQRGERGVCVCKRVCVRAGTFCTVHAVVPARVCARVHVRTDARRRAPVHMPVSASVHLRTCCTHKLYARARVHACMSVPAHVLVCEHADLPLAGWQQSARARKCVSAQALSALAVAGVHGRSSTGGQAAPSPAACAQAGRQRERTLLCAPRAAEAPLPRLLAALAPPPPQLLDSWRACNMTLLEV